jgi:hypothetical protein
LYTVLRAARRQHTLTAARALVARAVDKAEDLGGGIVRAGAQAGVPTPLHAAIAALVRGLEAGW